MRTLRGATFAFEGAPDDQTRDPQAIASLSRGLAILRAFGESSGPLSNQELAAATGLPKSTVSRITRTLTTDGFLVQVARSARYQLAPVILRLARSYHHATGIAEVAAPHMQELASAVRGTVAVAARDGLGMVYVAITRAVSRVDVPQEPGDRLPLLQSAVGLAYVHALPAGERTALLAAARRQAPRGWSAIEREVERTGDEIRRRGFCVCLGTWRPDVNAAGLGLALPDRSAVSFNVGGPAFWLKPDKIYADIGPRLAAMVRNVGAELARRGFGARA